MRRGLYRLNSIVLSCRLNAPNCISSRRSAGKLFHTRGPATEKLLSPKLLWVRCSRRPWSTQSECLACHKEIMFYTAFVCLSVCYKLTSSRTTDRIVVKILPEINLWTMNFPLNYVSHTDTDSRFKPAPHYRRSALAAFFKMFLFVACFQVSRRLRADQGGRLSEADNAWRRPGDAGHSGHRWTGGLRRRA